MAGKKNYSNNILLIFVILVSEFFISSPSLKLQDISEINLVIKGFGSQRILNKNYKPLPSEVLVNEFPVSKIEYFVYNLTNEENNITLRWNISITNCNEMFKDVSNITKINLSNFDASKVINMNGMFFGCSSLISIDLTSLNTSTVVNMHALFSRCTSLISINLDYLDTSSVIDMGYMFSRCHSLTSINLNVLNTSSVQYMNNIFYECNKSLIIHVNKIDTSSVKDMSYMFYSCSSLCSLDVTNFNTSSVYDMSFMFSNCSLLTSLDLYFFNTSAVKNMKYMFYNCNSLKILDLNNFDTKNVNNMRDMFSICSSLELIYLDNFDTSEVTDMSFMFNGSYSLISLNLENFNITKASNINSMFKHCRGLKYLNINTFEPLQHTNIDYLFFNCNSLISLNLQNFHISKFGNNVLPQHNKKIIYCFNNENVIQNVNNNCSDICLENQNNKIIKDKNICTENCTKDDTYKFEYNNICYDICPNGTHISNDNNYLCEKDLICSNYYNYDHSECLNQIPDGFYLNNSKLKTINKCEEKCEKCTYESSLENKCISCNIKLEYYPIYNNESQGFLNCYKEPLEHYYLDEIDNSFKVCYSTCKYCNNSGNETNNNCLICDENYILKGNNCYKRCEFYYYFDINNKYQCTLSNECPIDYNKLIPEKKECLKNCTDDENYQFEYNNICYKELPDITDISFDSTYSKEDYSNTYIYTSLETTEYIQECTVIEYMKGNCIINNYNKTLSKDEIIKMIENKIEDHSMDSLITDIIEEQKDLLIKEENLLLQITSTENQRNNKNKNISTIILGECENILKRVYNIKDEYSLIIFKIDYFTEGSLIPIIGYDVFHPLNKSKLDLNYCKNELVNFNIPVSIDEDNLFKYDPNSEYYTDKCLPYTTENGTDIILNDRHDEYNNNNMSICENNCTFIKYENNAKQSICDCKVKSKQLVISELMNQTDILTHNFENEGTTTNLISMKCYYTLFSKEGLYKNIENYILLSFTIFFAVSGILFHKCGYNLIEEDIKTIVKSKNENKKNIKKDIMNIETIEINSDKKNIIIKNKNRKIMKNKKNKKITTKNSNQRLNLNIIDPVSKSSSLSKNELKNSKYKDFIFSNKNININGEGNKQKISNPNDNYIIYELNSFTYEEALKNDKRGFWSYYLSLIRTKQLIIFSFCPLKDYNLRLIKIDLFVLSFSVYFFVNALFFDENLIHKIYKENGAYNFKELLPYILSSFIICHVINIILNKIFLSERNIYEITKDQSFYKVENEKKCLIIKYIIFYVGGTVFHILFWYYLSSFGAVYQNTQIYLIKNTFISFGFSLVYPFFINLIPAFLRIYSLKNNKCECFYKISKFIQLI